MKEFILEVPSGTKIEIREYDNCNTIVMYEKPQPILVHDLLIPEVQDAEQQEILGDLDLVTEE